MNLDEAKQLLAWMRANGVVSARIGEVALVLGDQPEPERVERPDDFEPRPKARYYTDPEDDPDLYDGETVPGTEPLPPKAKDSI